MFSLLIKLIKHIHIASEFFLFCVWIYGGGPLYCPYCSTLRLILLLLPRLLTLFYRSNHKMNYKEAAHNKDIWWQQVIMVIIILPKLFSSLSQITSTTWVIYISDCWYLLLVTIMLKRLSMIIKYYYCTVYWIPLTFVQLHNKNRLHCDCFLYDVTISIWDAHGALTLWQRDPAGFVLLKNTCVR